MTNVILPMANQKDLADIPEEFKKKLSFVFVENVDEVFAIAFDKKAGAAKPQGKQIKKPKSPAAAA